MLRIEPESYYVHCLSCHSLLRNLTRCLRATLSSICFRGMFYCVFCSLSWCCTYTGHFTRLFLSLQ